MVVERSAVHVERLHAVDGRDVDTRDGVRCVSPPEVNGERQSVVEERSLRTHVEVARLLPFQFWVGERRNVGNVFAVIRVERTELQEQVGRLSVEHVTRVTIRNTEFPVVEHVFLVVLPIGKRVAPEGASNVPASRHGPNRVKLLVAAAAKSVGGIETSRQSDGGHIVEGVRRAEISAQRVCFSLRQRAVSCSEPVFIEREGREVVARHRHILHTAVFEISARVVGNGRTARHVDFISRRGIHLVATVGREIMKVGLQASRHVLRDRVARVVHAAIRQFAKSRFALHRLL